MIRVELPIVTRTEDGPIRRQVEFCVVARYQPYDSPTFTDPGSPEGFEIEEILWSDGQTPVALTLRQESELRRIMIANVHAEEDERREAMERDRYTD